jgi:hypothetical protein
MANNVDQQINSLLHGRASSSLLRHFLRVSLGTGKPV